MSLNSAWARASSAGWYWPLAGVDRMSSIDEYYGLGVGALPTPMPVGVPELIGLTMRTPKHYVVTGRTGYEMSIGRRGRK
ncbi:MAG: hypothetical protein PHD37_17305 [Gallionellaceae bacterium]|nr:hypothetical protein [Gallionellaceae bacterium]